MTAPRRKESPHPLWGVMVILHDRVCGDILHLPCVSGLVIIPGRMDICAARPGVWWSRGRRRPRTDAGGGDG